MKLGVDPLDGSDRRDSPPDTFVEMSNDHWATGTPVQQWQVLSLRAWSRRFGVPYLLADTPRLSLVCDARFVSAVVGQPK
jgi:hypothetical protein